MVEQQLKELHTQIELTHEILRTTPPGSPGSEAARFLLAEMYKRLQELEPPKKNDNNKPLLSDDSL